MVPYSSFMQIKKKQGLNEITRFNLYPCATIQGAPAPGYSSGQALKAVQEVASDRNIVPQGYSLDYSGISYDESRKGNEALQPTLHRGQGRRVAPTRAPAPWWTRAS
jgi:HAE1 family hydrophobic/amphiphilic exporter-1